MPILDGDRDMGTYRAPASRCDQQTRYQRLRPPHQRDMAPKPSRLPDQLTQSINRAMGRTASRRFRSGQLALWLPGTATSSGNAAVTLLQTGNACGLMERQTRTRVGTVRAERVFERGPSNGYRYSGPSRRCSGDRDLGSLRSPPVTDRAPANLSESVAVRAESPTRRRQRSSSGHSASAHLSD